jgi:hypothetical protein
MATCANFKRGYAIKNAGEVVDLLPAIYASYTARSVKISKLYPCSHEVNMRELSPANRESSFFGFTILMVSIDCAVADSLLISLKGLHTCFL